jgi:hypothetical protein
MAPTKPLTPPTRPNLPSTRPDDLVTGGQVESPREILVDVAKEGGEQLVCEGAELFMEERRPTLAQFVRAAAPPGTGPAGISPSMVRVYHAYTYSRPSTVEAIHRQFCQ